MNLYEVKKKDKVKRQLFYQDYLKVGIKMWDINSFQCD